MICDTNLVASQHGDCECVADEAESAEPNDDEHVDEDSLPHVYVVRRHRVSRRRRGTVAGISRTQMTVGIHPAVTALRVIPLTQRVHVDPVGDVCW